jgi:outer membrane protein assembly factor BamE (lipoprotein component of BamABCDE complex)
MKAIKTILFVCTISTFFELTACSTGTVAIKDQSLVSKIHIGRSTTKDVELLLGKPVHVELSENGETVWSYVATDTSWKAFVPGLNMTGDSIKSQDMVIRFSKQGVVKAMGSGEIKL